MRDRIKTLTDIPNTYGNICHFKLGRQHIYLVNDPNYIEDILIRNYKNFIKTTGLQVANRLLGEGLLTSEGGYQDRQRRLILPTFHPNRIKGYGGIITNHAIRDTDGKTLDMHKEMMHVTLESTTA